MNPVEIFAVVFSVIYVILAVKGNWWCWISGIIASVLYIIFDLELKYYQDAILQSYYVVAGFYGLYLWKFRIDNSHEGIEISSWKREKLLPFIIAGLILFPIAGYIFSKLGNAFPYVDAFTTVFSFIATWLTAKKILESWLMWIVIDLIFIVQYFLKDAIPTSGLYLFLTIMAVYGYIEWKKKLVAK